MDAKDAEERVRGTLQPVKKEDCEVGLTVIQLLLKVKNFQRIIVNIFLPINFNICFGCSKEPSY